MQEKPIVYTCFSTDVIHEGHLNILKKAKSIKGNGKVIVGVMSDKKYAEKY